LSKATDSKSKSQLLADHINEKLAAKVDLTSIDARKKDFAEFLKKYPKGEFSKSLYIDILKREIIRKGYDPRAYGLSQGKIPSFQSSQRDMKSTVTPKPTEARQQTQVGAPFTPQPTTGVQTPQLLAPPGATQAELKTEAAKYVIAYTATNVGVTLKAFYSVLKLKWEFLEDLTNEEKDTLGELWLPAFQRWMQGEYSIIIIPLLATLGLLSPKIKKAQRIAKAQGKGEKESKEKKTESKAETTQDTEDEKIFNAKKSPS